MAFLDGDETLHLGITPNARSRIAYLKDRASDNAGIAEIFDVASHLAVQPFETGLAALIAFKASIQDLHPRLQNNFRPWDEYVYLALNAYRFPFIRITADTNDDSIFAGPFRDRFFLIDVLDAVCRILRLPRCETGDWPCEKLDRNLCGGYCRSLDEVQGDPAIALEKLEELLNESFLHPNNGILEMLRHERDKYFNDLEFIKADLLGEEIELQQKYRDWLIFLYTARRMNFEDGPLLVENGRIRRCRYQGRDYLFPPDSTQYRENETLAFNLDSVDEARIIYEFYIKHNKG